MMPVPLKAIVWGLPLALSVMETDALRAPVAVGAKITLIMQSAPNATLLPQLFVWEKSSEFAPVRPTPVMLRAAVPLLVSMTLCATLGVRIFWELKTRVAAERLTAGGRVGAVALPAPPPPQAAHSP